jgi:hypothetical protein
VHSHKESNNGVEEGSGTRIPEMIMSEEEKRTELDR